MACLSDAASIIAHGAKFCKAVHDYINQMDKNLDYCESIKSIVGDMESAALELKKLENDDLSEYFMKALRKWGDSLDIARETFNFLQRQSSGQQFLRVRSNRAKLESLEQALKNARSSVQLALQIAGQMQHKDVKETVQRECTGIKNMIMNEDQGYYVNPKGHKKIPGVVGKPEVSLDQENRLLVVNWIDRKNVTTEVDRYDILYDDENYSTIGCNPQDAVTDSCGNKFTVKLGHPIISPGNLYNIKIRAVNGVGAGKWSESFLIRFLQGPPAQPLKPTLAVLSPTEVSVKVKLLSGKEERGSPVTRCRVEFTELHDKNATSLSSKMFPIKKNNEAVNQMEFKAASLKSRTQYKFRVVMVNGIGESIPSHFSEAFTEWLVPGPPQKVRISSKRTSNTLKVRWNPPIDNPAGVKMYKIQYRKKYEKEWDTCCTEDGKKYSQKVIKLNTDTVYHFQVQSVNDNGEGSTSERIEGETRYGAFGRGVATIAALVGGTVGGPVLGAGSLGYVSATAAKQGPDSAVGRKAAAVAAGIAGGVGGALLGTVGAPIMGISSAVVTCWKLEGKMDDISPQNSDNEDAELSIEDMICRQSIATAEAMVKRNL